VFIDLTPEQRHQAELRQYFSTLITPDEAAAMESDRHNEAYRAVIKRMGSDGKLGVGWPKEYGGHGLRSGRTADLHQRGQSRRRAAAAGDVADGRPTLQAYGTEAQKKKFLPAILAGDIHFAIGYSEPEAGTDLASLRTSAVRRGDEYIVNGQKMWTTGAHDADYIWLACRTDPECRQAQGHLDPDRRHQGSGLLLDPDHPVRRRTPHQRLVLQRRPGSADMLVGEENGGWKLITTQLNHERVGLGPAGRMAGIYEKVHTWAPSRAATVSPLWRTTTSKASGADQGDLADQRTAQLAGGRVR
jgi:alkylation response protein AidB-like acyl-CoA dehydrogenase